MKTLNLTHVGRLAELAAGRAWSTIPLRGATLQQALRAVENPAAGVGAVLKPLRVNAEKSVRDIVAQRQRLSQALSRAAVRNTGANVARHQALMKRGSVIRAIDDYVIPQANPLLGSASHDGVSASMRADQHHVTRLDRCALGIEHLARYELLAGGIRHRLGLGFVVAGERDRLGPCLDAGPVIEPSLRPMGRRAGVAPIGRC